jgi:hypothetical protein
MLAWSLKVGTCQSAAYISTHQHCAEAEISNVRKFGCSAVVNVALPQLLPSTEAFVSASLRERWQQPSVLLQCVRVFLQQASLTVPITCTARYSIDHKK